MTETFCDTCGTWYASGVTPIGEVCGDQSQGQAEPCHDRVVEFRPDVHHPFGLAARERDRAWARGVVMEAMRLRRDGMTSAEVMSIIDGGVHERIKRSH